MRLTVLAFLSLAIWLSTTSSRPRDDGRPGSAEQLAAAAAATAAADSSMGRPGDGRAASTARPLYGLPQPELESAVVAASERYGPVAKAGPVPQEFWTDERRPWRERVFMEMLKRGALATYHLLRCFSMWLPDCACRFQHVVTSLPMPGLLHSPAQCAGGCGSARAAPAAAAVPLASSQQEPSALCILTSTF